MDNVVVINKKNIINFFKYFEHVTHTIPDEPKKINKNKNIKEDKLIEDEILKFYDFKTKLLIIDKNDLTFLIKKFEKNILIKTLSSLFRNKKIEFPYVNLSIPLNIIYDTIYNIFETTNIESTASIENDIIPNINLDTIKFPENFNVKNYKTNLNYFLINYFAEIDILNCKRKTNFITPLALIYSENNFLEQIFSEIIDKEQIINSLNIKIYLKKNIAFCVYNNIIHLIIIIKHLIKLDNNINVLDILNIGLDWGEWNILAHFFKDINFQSYYFNNLQESTIKNIQKSFTNNNNIIQEHFNYNLLSDKLNKNYFVLFLNLEYLFNFYLDKQIKINDILTSKILPLLNSINAKFIVLKNYSNFDNKSLINLINSSKSTHNNNFEFNYNLTIETSIYSIFTINQLIN